MKTTRMDKRLVCAQRVEIALALVLAFSLTACSDEQSSALATQIVQAGKDAVEEGVSAGQTAITEGGQAVQTQTARREMGRRVLVLLQGMNSSNHAEGMENATEFCTWFDLKLALPTKEHRGLYDDVIHYSYAGPGEPYTASDTQQAIDASVNALEATITTYLREPGHELAVFDLVGHSLGGVVAWRFASEWGIVPSNAVALHHVATLHSPINGSSVLAAVHRRANAASGPIEGEVEMRSVWGEATTSQAAQDLASMSESNTLRNQNIVVANLLKAQGVQVQTFASAADEIISTSDATITGFKWTQDLGTGALITSCATAPASQLNAASAVGHNQVLHRGEALVPLKEFLER